MIVVDELGTDYECVECGNPIVFDVDVLDESFFLQISVYCANIDCDFYEGRTINPITGEDVTNE